MRNKTIGRIGVSSGSCLQTAARQSRLLRVVSLCWNWLCKRSLHNTPPMSLSWNIRNSLLWLATAGMGAAACFGIPSTTKWLKDSQETKSNAGEAIPKPALKRSTLDLPTEEELERASSVNLQRMNPPKALPPPAKPVVVAEPPPQVPVVLFQGTLLGTIEDSDPKYCFALLKGTDNRVKLVAHKLRHRRNDRNFSLLFEYSPLSIRLSWQLLFRLLIFALRPGVHHVFLPSFSEGAAHWCR